MGVTSTGSAEFDTYELKGVSHTWVNYLKVDRATDVGPIE